MCKSQQILISRQNRVCQGSRLRNFCHPVRKFFSFCRCKIDVLHESIHMAHYDRYEQAIAPTIVWVLLTGLASSRRRRSAGEEV